MFDTNSQRELLLSLTGRSKVQVLPKSYTWWRTFSLMLFPGAVFWLVLMVSFNWKNSFRPLSFTAKIQYECTGNETDANFICAFQTYPPLGYSWIQGNWTFEVGASVRGDLESCPFCSISCRQSTARACTHHRSWQDRLHQASRWQH